jgi:AAA+ ATPase superfamily predicted ATPase
MLLFKIGKPVVGAELIGREKEVKLLYSYAKGGQSVIISAPRRYGKTSIILEVLERFKRDGYHVGYLDIFEAVSVRELSERIVETLLSNERLSARRFFDTLKKDISEALSTLEFKAIFEDYKFVLGFSSKDVDEYKLFDEALDFIQEYAQRKGRVIFAIECLDGRFTELAGAREGMWNDGRRILLTSLSISQSLYLLQRRYHYLKPIVR